MPEAFARCADVMLAVADRELPVHSQVLASKSAFFAGMWAGGAGSADLTDQCITIATGTGNLLQNREPLPTCTILQLLGLTLLPRLRVMR